MLISPATHARLKLDWEERGAGRGRRPQAGRRRLGAARAGRGRHLSLGYVAAGAPARMARGWASTATCWRIAGAAWGSRRRHQGAGRALQLRLHAEPPRDRPRAGHRRGQAGGREGHGPPHHPHRHRGRAPAQDPTSAPGGDTAAQHDPLPQPHLRGARLGYGNRSQRLHRVQLLRRRLPGREQHPGGGQGPGSAAARCIGSASTAISPATWTTRSCTTSRCPACSARTLPASLSAPWAPPTTAPKG